MKVKCRKIAEFFVPTGTRTLHRLFPDAFYKRPCGKKVAAGTWVCSEKCAIKRRALRVRPHLSRRNGPSENPATPQRIASL